MAYLTGGRIYARPTGAGELFKTHNLPRRRYIRTIPVLCERCSGEGLWHKSGSLPTRRQVKPRSCRQNGKRGNKADNILEESYFKVYFGITFNDQLVYQKEVRLRMTGCHEAASTLRRGSHRAPASTCWSQCKEESWTTDQELKASAEQQTEAYENALQTNNTSRPLLQ